MAPPFLASNLLLYLYQLYQLHLASTGAVTLIVVVLEGTDLLYLTKIASTIQLQVVVSITLEVQISIVNKFGARSVIPIATWKHVASTAVEQVLKLLQQDDIYGASNIILPCPGS
jgi:hypothetical protein